MSTVKEILTSLLANLPDDLPKIHESAWISPKDIPFSAEVRELCRANRCGRYGKSWSCPPGVGEWTDLRDRYQSFDEAFLFTTCHELEDSFDYEGMLAAGDLHKKLDDLIADALYGFNGKCVHLSAGACNICEKCTYPDAQCRFPDKARQSLEASGIDVVSLARVCGVRYINGPETVTYFSLILM